MSVEVMTGSIACSMNELVIDVTKTFIVLPLYANVVVSLYRAETRQSMLPLGYAMKRGEVQ